MRKGVAIQNCLMVQKKSSFRYSFSPNGSVALSPSEMVRVVITGMK